MGAALHLLARDADTAMVPVATKHSRGWWATQLLVVAIGAACGAVVVYFLVGKWHGFWHMDDFKRESWPPYLALERGHLLEFVRRAPAYVGSLVLRAPFLPLAGLFGRGWRAAYAATVIPCLLAGPILGVWLSHQPRARAGAGLASKVSPIVLCGFNPIVIVALGFGHPEDVLGASLCVAAVVLAARGSAGWAALLVGLAVVNKSWALVAVPVVFAVLPARRTRALVTLALTVGAVLGPVFAIRYASLDPGGAATSFGSQTGNLFLIPQILWWFGPHSWIVHEAHVLIVLVAFACGGAWWAMRGRRGAHNPEPTEALLLLMLVMFLRAALDPWDNLYYQTPFLFAMMAYESRRPPKLTAVMTCLLVLIVPPKILGGSRPFEAALYTALAVPTITLLGIRVLRGPGSLDALRRAALPWRQRAATAYGP
jgi:hypothetical protein